jgi:diguanylate cyclase (GGDEF)-like protein
VRELSAVALGCAAFFLFDYLVSAVSLALEDRSPLRGELRQSTGLAALGVFVAIDSLGYLAALVQRGLPSWAILLLAVPVFTILVATRALSRGREHRRGSVRSSTPPPRRRSSSRRPSSRRCCATTPGRRWRAGSPTSARKAPMPKEIGARVRAGEQTMWLVAPAVNRARPRSRATARPWRRSRTVGEEAFARLSLTDEMGRLARHDALTSLPNRTLFLDRVEQGVIRARRNDTTLAVLFLDLDGFKGVNDRFGHAEGDELLKIVAARLVACVRAVDSVARLGGDEFAVLLEGVDGVGELDILCQRLLVALRREIHVMGHEVGGGRQHRGRGGRPHRRRPWPAAQRGHGDVPGQGAGQGPVLRLPAVAARGERPPAGAHRGAPARASRPSSSCTTSRSSTWPVAASRVSRRWSAGSVPTAWWRRTRSSWRPRRAA